MSDRFRLARVLPGSLALAGALLLTAGCGGGGSSGGVDGPSGNLILGGPVSVTKLETPLGVTGTRGSGGSVFVSFVLRDKEFNPADIQIEYGYDLDGVDGITGSATDPTDTDEYFPATPVDSMGEGKFGLTTAGGKGARHLFVWDSTRDLKSARIVTLDFENDALGRVQLDTAGLPKFVTSPGIRMRMRANDGVGLANAEKRWGAWTVTKPFDLNNNSQPAVTLAATGLNGVTPNATGTAADENVVLNFNVIDPDSLSADTQDPVSVAVDFARVPQFSPVDRDGNTLLDDPFDVNGEDAASLQWFPTTPAPGVTGIGYLSAPGAGLPATFTWDSIADVGTVNGKYLLRATPFDSKKEHGPTVAMAAPFTLDNYTVFTDPGVSLGAARVGHRATTLVDDRVLVTGGRTTTAGASVATAEIFFPGVGQTTFGAISPTAPMGTARSHHAQVRLQDGRVLVAGGFAASGAPMDTLAIYDPSTGQWAAVGDTLSAPRARATAVVLSDGDVLVAGGVDGTGAPLGTADLFRVATETVDAVPGTMAEARSSVEGALLPDGRVLIPGGRGAGGSALLTTEIFDPSANGGAGAFAAGAPMATARADHSVSNGVDGRVVVAGGAGVNTIAVYDPATGAWNNGAPAMATSRGGHAGFLLGDGTLFLAGGGGDAGVLNTGLLFDPVAMTYDTPNGTMAAARRDAAAVMLNNGRSLIIGGTDAAGTTTASMVIFTPDGGFNRLPVATVVTPPTAFSWQFGAVLRYRLVDAEGDPARVLFQYSESGGPWLTCTEKPSTIAGDLSDGTLSLVTSPTGSSLPVDPILKNTIGDHNFIWNIQADLVKADYSSIRVRAFPIGANPGQPSTTQPWKINKNTFVIARFDPFVADVAGTIDLAYHLQDLDGDSARVTVEFARDLDGDKQILEESGEVWTSCREAPGGDGLGAGYTLSTSTAFDPDTSTAGWHHFLWDSVRDLGSPLVGEAFTDVFVRVIPYDFPAGDPFETTGRAAVMTNDDGLTVVLDPAGLYLVAWGTEGGATYGGAPVGNVKLDETLVFTFNQEVDAASVEGTAGYDSIQITVGGRRILGAYQVDTGNAKIVRFFPQMNDVVNFALKYDGSEDPTVFVRGMTASLYIPAYVAGTDPATSPGLRVNGWTAGDAAVDVVNLLPTTHAPALTTTLAPGTAGYFSRGVAPLAVGVNPPLGSTAGGAQPFEIEFDHAISPDSANFQGLRFVVDLNGNDVADPNDSIIAGSVSVTNVAGPPGTAKATLIFTPLPGTVLPSGSRILASFAGITAGDGTVALGFGGGSPVTSYSTTAGTSSTVTFTESFANTTNRDTANTTALWNVSPYTGMLTGLRIGGTGADGPPVANSVSGNVRTFSSKAAWNFSALTIPKGEIWRFTGGPSNLPVEILVLGDIDIAGVLDVSGSDGEGHFDEVLTVVTTMPAYGKRYTSIQSSGATALVGGVGIAGGGAGGSSRHFTTGFSGTNGFGATASNFGGAGVQYTTTYQNGGGGAGHAQVGQSGGQYTSGYGTVGPGGAAYGTTTFSSGMTAGSGGGSGSSFSTQYQVTDKIVFTGTATQTFYYCHPGASGGAGGGALKIASNGTFRLRGSGYIDASGGNGGDGYYYYAGGGGGGSGGSVWIISGAALNIGGIVDVRGGIGGETLAYHPYAASTSTGTRYGTFGGHGSAGRVRVEGPSVGTVQTNFQAGTSFNTIASGSVSGGTGSLGAFPGSSSTTINIDGIAKDGSGFMNFTTMSIPSGVTVTLSGSTAAKMRFTGNVAINGVLSAPGGTGAIGTAATGTAPVIAAGAAGPGGYPGGLPNGSGMTSFPSTPNAGLSGGGAGGGPGGYRGYGYISGSATYYYGASASAGGTNLLNSRGTPFGTALGGFPATYNNLRGEGNVHCYYGAGYGSNRVQAFAKAGYNDPEALTMTSLLGGSGGGGGTTGGYISGATTYFSTGSSGGGGAGAIGIETAGTFSMGSAGRFDVIGGNAGTYAATYQYGGGGGGGSGGTVLVRANNLTFTAGATLNAHGGIGGNNYSGSTAYNMGCGGVGGIGAAKFEAVTQTNILNVGGILGYSTAGSGSLTTGAASGGGDTGTTLWQTAAALSPDFNTQVVNKVGTMDIFLEGAMPDPVTGLRGTAFTGQQNLVTTPLTTGLAVPDAIDGYKFWRLVFKLQPGGPELYDVSLKVTTQ